MIGDQFSVPVESVASLQSPIPGQSSVAANFAVPIRLFVPMRVSLPAEFGGFTKNSPPCIEFSVPVQFMVPMTFVVPSDPASGSRSHGY